MPRQHPCFPRPKTARTNALAAKVGIAGVLLLTACSPNTEPATEDSIAATAPGYPTSHIHGMSVDPATNQVLLATHDGLYNVSTSPITKIGPTIDLMGFTTTANGDFYASGHPGQGSELPDPVGLLHSTDDGQTWQPLSRQGESDFHALAATHSAIVGYDGQLLTSEDGTSWDLVEEPVPAFNLAATPRDSIVLATTEKGLQRSTDDGQTWSSVPKAPLLMFTTLSEGQAAGITPEGRIYTSSNAGLTWMQQGTVPGTAAAIAAHALDDSTLRIWVATEDSVQVSNDNGTTFTDIRSNHQ